MLIRQSRNERVVRYLERNSRGRLSPEGRPPGDTYHDYWECGSHPDIVERLWDQLGKPLPKDCRQVVMGSPALVHPGSGVVLALAIGTQYALRVPGRVLRDGLPAGARTQNTWSGGGQMNIQEEFGADWVFGKWDSSEEAWCLECFQEQEAG